MDPKLAVSAPGRDRRRDRRQRRGDRACPQARTFDYDAPIEGLKALDRYTWQVQLNDPNLQLHLQPRRLPRRAAPWRARWSSAMARTSARTRWAPAPTLAFWKRSSKIVFETNPDFREEYFDAEAAPTTAGRRRSCAQQKGKRLPMIDRVEVYDHRGDAAALALVPQQRDGPDLPRARGVRQRRRCRTTSSRPTSPGAASRCARSPPLDLTYAYFNMDDPVIGGYTPEQASPCAARSRSATTSSDEIAIIRKEPGDSPRRRRTAPAWRAASRTSARWPASTARRRPRRCSTCSATSIATATATARCPTAARSTLRVQLDAHVARRADGRALEAEHGRHRPALHGAQGGAGRTC